MSDSIRLFVQLGTNIIIAGFVVVMAFLQMAEYIGDKHKRHLFSTAAWLILLPVFILRTLGAMVPPPLVPQMVMDWVTIGWGTSMLLALIWGILRIRDKTRESAALKRIVLEQTKTETEHE